MLREMMWHFGTTTKCCFCKKPLLDPGATAIEYGERNSPPVKIKLAIHHENENHEDNDPKNRKPAHSSCHRRYHIMKQHAKANGKRIGSDTRKKNREKREKQYHKDYEQLCDAILNSGKRRRNEVKGTSEYESY